MGSLVPWRARVYLSGRLPRGFPARLSHSALSPAASESPSGSASLPEVDIASLPNGSCCSGSVAHWLLICKTDTLIVSPGILVHATSSGLCKALSSGPARRGSAAKCQFMFYSLGAQRSCPRCLLYVILLKAPSLCENMGLRWSRLLQGSVKRPLCVSFKSGLRFVPLTLCKGTGQRLLAPGQARPREL